MWKMKERKRENERKVRLVEKSSMYVHECSWIACECRMNGSERERSKGCVVYKYAWERKRGRERERESKQDRVTLVQLLYWEAISITL